MALKRALISVSDKRGIVEFARALSSLGVELLSTGGTARALREGGVSVTDVSAYTGAPELFEGRVKTLHPRIHGGLLFRRDHPDDVRAAREHGIEPIDLVTVNLYPKGGEIDIGGPSLIRAAAKNADAVTVLVDPADYAPVLDELRARGDTAPETRKRLQAKAFAHTAAYDAFIAEQLSEGAFRVRPALRAQALRYGENPHQKGAFFRDPEPSFEPSLAAAETLQGKELSYNNILDAAAALECAKEFDGCAAVVVKHNNPCGVALGETALQAYRRARDADPVSAFGGIVALNRAVDAACAELLAETFLEVVLAPAYGAAAREILARKKNLRVLAVPGLQGPRAQWKRGGEEVRSVPGGLLVQDRDVTDDDPAAWKCVTRRAPGAEEAAALDFAWRVAKHARSNAIVLAAGGVTRGIGMGQTNRVDSVRHACARAGASARGAVLASDGFFPFPDGVEAAAEAGVVAVAQPGGSMRDADVIAAADARGLAMLFTGTRHFRH
jgi:phosphoribosylaminoimidazolecarboxamide formyltransferase/IMP cyclohydrolase